MRIGKLAMVLLAVAAFSCGVWAADAYTPRTGAFDAGYYAIFSASSGLALTVDHETCTEDGAGIFLWEYEGFACQEWQILEYGEGIYSVVNRQSGKALTLDWYSIFEAGSGIVQWYDLGYPPSRSCASAPWRSTRTRSLDRTDGSARWSSRARTTRSGSCASSQIAPRNVHERPR